MHTDVRTNLTASQFLNERERSILAARIASDGESASKEPFQWSQVRAALVDPFVWGYSILFHAFAFPLCSSFLPLLRAILMKEQTRSRYSSRQSSPSWDTPIGRRNFLRSLPTR